MLGSEYTALAAIRARGEVARLRIGHRVFAPSAIATVVTIALLVLLLGLGRWQIQRMHEKAALFAAFERGGQESVSLDALPAGTWRQFQQVNAHGSYDSSRQVLLDNMTHEGRAGFQVLTPFHTDGGKTVLVNRGWLPSGATREELPDVTVGEAPRTVSGKVSDLPRAGIDLGAQQENPGRWPALMSYPRIEQLRALLGSDVAQHIVLLDADQPDGFVREWRPTTFPPERHLGYAVTWFALAAALVIAYGLTNFRTERAP